MKKILTTLAAVALTVPAWGAVPKFYPAQVPFVFAEPGEEINPGQPCKGVKYEDGTLLVKNESFRALAVWWDGFKSVSDDYIPFELNVQGEPVPVSGVVGAEFIWMQTTDSGTSQTYAPVGDIAGIAGIRYSTEPSLFWSRFSLLGETVEKELPDEYKGDSYRVYLITLDTRLDGEVSAGVPTRIVKWKATYAATCSYSMNYQRYIAINFTYDDESFTTLSDITPTRRPYVEVPETDTSTDEEVDAAVAALEATLKEADYAKITKINNPAVPNVILDPGIALTEDGVVTFEYDFGISDISVTQANTVEVKVKLGEEHTFAEGVTVTVSLIDADGTELELTGTTDSTNPNVYTFMIQLETLNAAEQGSSTLTLRAKAAKTLSQE